MNRPGGVTVIAVMEFLGGALCVLVGLGAMLGGGILATIISQSGAENRAAGAGIMGAMGAALGVIVLLFAVLYFITGWGMLRLKSWSRIVTMILAGLVILGSLVGLSGAFMHFNLFVLFWLAVRLGVGGWILWYLLQPNVSAAFDGGQTRAASA